MANQLSSSALLSENNIKPEIPNHAIVLWVGPNKDQLEVYMHNCEELLTNFSNVNNFYELNAKYYGSSTRCNPIGTVFFTEGTRESFGKHIRITMEGTILYDFYVTAEQFLNHSNDLKYSVHLGDVTIFLHPLNRFEGSPFEISGVKFFIH
jgi:hypothetical protein